jgi:NAD(P)-dependent dehydrogenase (short-subunit alcohol dehydrogenase family)
MCVRSSRGLGRHFALSLAQAGASVAVAARSVDKLAQAVAEIKAAGGQGLAVGYVQTELNRDFLASGSVIFADGGHLVSSL